MPNMIQLMTESENITKEKVESENITREKVVELEVNFPTT